MGLFSSPNLNYLGVDIGSAGIKVVEFKNEAGRPRLMTYGFVEEEVDIVHNLSTENQKKAAEILRKILIKARTTTKMAIVALPSFSVFSSIISLPPMNQKELDSAIRWQAKKFVPLPLDEMTLDWKLLGDDKPDKKEKKEKDRGKNKNQESEETKTERKIDDLAEQAKSKSRHLRVLIAAAPKKLVLRYVNIFKTAELELLSLETENFALERALIGNRPNPIMIVDIGSITSDISVAENGIPLLSRSVDAGGEMITQSIMNSMQVDHRRAEQFKRDIGFSGGQGGLPKVIETAITPIINEIKYCFDLYSSQQSSQRIEKIILTGGSAFLPNITGYLEKLLNIKVQVGDPWSRVIYPVELKSILDDLAPRFSVAVGLAMREIV